MSINRNETTSSEQNLVDQCQLKGFHSFKERLSFCCCRLFRKSSSYHLNDIQKKSEDQIHQKPNSNSSTNQNKENIERQNKLDLIAKTLPPSKSTIKEKIPSIATKPIEPKRNLKEIVVKGTRQVSPSSSSDESTDDQSSTESSDSESD